MTVLSRRKVTFGLLASVLPLGTARASYSATRNATAFGTIVSLTAKGDGERQVESALDASFVAIRAVEQAFSLFNAKSELSRFNRTGTLSNPSWMFVDLLHKSADIWLKTDGAFDPSVQPLWDLWSKADREGPDADTVALARSRIGFNHLRIKSSRITTGLPGLQLTMNGIAQGYAADLVATIMRQHGIAAAQIDTGEIGSLGTELSHDNLSAVQDPRNPAKLIGTIAAGHRFLATSGDYATSFSADFSAHHIFDPRTGFSPKELAAVSVLAPTGATADALATAFMVTGGERALKMIAQMESVDVLLISKSGDILMSEGMDRVFIAA
jgi:FAD:protein FMN transferase